MTEDTRTSPMGVNPIANQAPTEAVEGAYDTEMYEAATLLGADHEMSDVGFAFGAQAEVVTADS